MRRLALKGMDAIDLPTLRKVVDDKDARVASAAIRMSEPLMVTRRGTGMLDDVLPGQSPEVRLQFVLSISDVSNEKAQQAWRMSSQARQISRSCATPRSVGFRSASCLSSKNFLPIRNGKPKAPAARD